MTKEELLGKKVWWEDPEGFSSDWFTVDNVRCDDDEEIIDETIIEISNDFSSAEITYDEITIIEMN